VANWLHVLGEKRHYHFAQLAPFFPGSDPFDNAIRALYPFIPEGSRVLDCGCGWGGPADLLREEKGCEVTGITISQQQHAFLQNKMPCVRADLETYEPEEGFERALFVECLTHLADPQGLFTRLAKKVPRIVMREVFSRTGQPFAHPHWKMHFRTKEQIQSYLREAGYVLNHFEEVLMVEDLHYCSSVWLKQLNSLPREAIKGQLEVLQKSCYSWTKLRSLANLEWSLGIFYATKEEANK
jgi:cyclopropane fatty-acyl-phospholipid synthase-like methyltransferase